MSSQAILDALLAAIEAKHSVALVTVITAKGPHAASLGRRAIFQSDAWIAGTLDLSPMIKEEIQAVISDGNSTVLAYDEGALEIFVEVLQRSPVLFVVGAGHVAQPLAQLGKLVDFQVVVLDDRPQYANKARFPLADQVIATPFVKTLRDWPIDDKTYFVLVTRGHNLDVECLLEVLDSDAAYIGMIGSKRRVKAVFNLLSEQYGIARQKFETIHAPIGLDIGAETPAEIAVCIIAEIINLYRGGRAQTLSQALRANQRQALHPGRRKIV